ncbi:MAG: Cd(II)/Pb(II)-responsive transcriptional regulator [Betaproteobacteria bacterium]
MRVGQLAAATGVDVETIRYYEREGLVPAPPRNASGYRAYDEAAVRRLTFIRHCRSLDVRLADVRQLLSLLDCPDRGCGTADAVVDAQIVRVRERIASLHALEATLVALRSRCASPTTSASCRILEELARPA